MWVPGGGLEPFRRVLLSGGLLPLKRNERRATHRPPCEQSLFCRFFERPGDGKKEALHKSALAFEVAVAPNLGLAIPVYSRQTGFSSASINFYDKPMIETEPTGCKKHMAAKGPAKGDRAKMLDDALLTRKHQSASVKSFTSGTFVSLPGVIGHGKSFIL